VRDLEVTHTCVWTQEHDGQGRRILPPCPICGLTALQRIAELQFEVASLRGAAGTTEIHEGGTITELPGELFDQHVHDEQSRIAEHTGQTDLTDDAIREWMDEEE
jgi:hypothetical protein